MTYIDMLFLRNGTLKYVGNNKIMSNFSKDMIIVTFYWPSFAAVAMCAVLPSLKLGYTPFISRLFLYVMNINESVISVKVDLV